jgi:hypothetical protein
MNSADDMTVRHYPGQGMNGSTRTIFSSGRCQLMVPIWLTIFSFCDYGGSMQVQLGRQLVSWLMRAVCGYMMIT